MILIVDAYNILKQVLSDAYITNKQRKQFITMLTNYAAIKKHMIIVVFDGGPDVYPAVEKGKNIVVVYSGAHMSADDYIRTYITKSTNQDMLLISSDAGIAAWADEHNVESLDSMTFYSLVWHELSKQKDIQDDTKDHVVKLSKQENEELDALMVSEHVPQKKAIEESDRARKKQQHSKQERKMLKKIAKL